MKQTCHIKHKEKYETVDLKLSALILCSIPKSTFDTYQEVNNTKKTIRIFYSVGYKDEVNKLIADFINKRAWADVYLFNKAISEIRDRLKGEKSG